MTQIKKLRLVSALLSALGGFFWLLGTPCNAQANTDRAVFKEEQHLLKDDQSQQKQLLQEKQQYEQELQAQQAQDEPYKLYAEKQVEELKKLRDAGGSPVISLSQQHNGQLYALEKWLQTYSNTSLEERQHVAELDKAIASLQTDENQTLNNLQSDVNGLRGDSSDTIADKRFQQQMEINQFNEEQSEMGWLSQQGRPRDLYGLGYLNSPFANNGFYGRRY